MQIPDELMRRVKLRAVNQNLKLQEAVAQLLELGMAAAPERAPAARPPKPVKLRKRRALTIEDIEQAISAGRD